MGRTSTKKMLLLMLLRILWKHADEEHIRRPDPYIIEKCVIITENRNKYHGTISLLKIELSLYNANVVTERM